MRRSIRLASRLEGGAPEANSPEPKKKKPRLDPSSEPASIIVGRVGKISNYLERIVKRLGEGGNNKGLSCISAALEDGVAKKILDSVQKKIDTDSGQINEFLKVHVASYFSLLDKVVDCYFDLLKISKKIPGGFSKIACNDKFSRVLSMYQILYVGSQKSSQSQAKIKAADYKLILAQPGASHLVSVIDTVLLLVFLMEGAVSTYLNQPSSDSDEAQKDIISLFLGCGINKPTSKDQLIKKFLSACMQYVVMRDAIWSFKDRPLNFTIDQYNAFLRMQGALQKFVVRVAEEDYDLLLFLNIFMGLQHDMSKPTQQQSHKTLRLHPAPAPRPIAGPSNDDRKENLPGAANTHSTHDAPFFTPERQPVYDNLPSPVFWCLNRGQWDKNHPSGLTDSLLDITGWSKQ